MNYILHLNAFYKRANADSRMTPYHISLYMGIFQLWNAAHFKNPFYVSRQELMELSKIGSTSTYHHHLKDLDTWKYIQYSPSKSISQGSRIRCITYGTSSRTSKDTSDATCPDSNGELRLVHSNKRNKTLENSTNILSLKNIKKFFETNNSNSREAKKFFNHHEEKAWMNDTEPIVDWQALALEWIANQQELPKTSKRKSLPSIKRTPKFNSNPKTKRYDEPL